MSSNAIRPMAITPGENDRNLGRRFAAGLFGAGNVEAVDAPPDDPSLSGSNVATYPLASTSTCEGCGVRTGRASFLIAGKVAVDCVRWLMGAGVVFGPRKFPDPE